MLEAGKIISAARIEPRPVPVGVLIPLLEKASLEEDDFLRTRWAALLATSATRADGILPSFVSILGELSPVGPKGFRLFTWLCMV